MSYILDALKKSEQERKSQPVIDIATPQSHPSRPKPERKKWLWIVPALLTANIVLLIWPAPSPDTTAVTAGFVPLTEPRSLPPQAAENTPEVINSPESLTQTRRTAPSLPMTADPLTNDSQDASPIQRYHRDPFAPLEGDPEPAAAAPLSVTEAPSAMKAAGATKTTIALHNPDVEQLNRSLLNQALIEQLAPLRQPPPPQIAAAPSTAPDSSSMADALALTDNHSTRIPLLSELDADTQNTIPDLKVSVHIYAQAPDQRMARINGKMLHEGQNLNSDLRLTEIRPESLVFSFRGRSFQLLR